MLQLCPDSQGHIQFLRDFYLKLDDDVAKEVIRFTFQKAILLFNLGWFISQEK
jgi:hypothetical protein